MAGGGNKKEYHQARGESKGRNGRTCISERHIHIDRHTGLTRRHAQTDRQRYGHTRTHTHTHAVTCSAETPAHQARSVTRGSKHLSQRPGVARAVLPQSRGRALLIPEAGAAAQRGGWWGELWFGMPHVAIREALQGRAMKSFQAKRQPTNQAKRQPTQANASKPYAPWLGVVWKELRQLDGGKVIRREDEVRILPRVVLSQECRP